MRARRSSFGVCAVVLLLLTGSVRAQLSSAAIDHLVEDAMKKFDVVGVAVGVVKDDRVVHAKGYGLRSIASADRVDKDTNFEIASNSKAFTTTALAILVDEGKLSWRDTVKKYIPEFTMYNAYVTENFTIEDLLTHRSGLGLGAGDLMFFPDGSDFTMKDILSSFRYFEPKSGFRTRFDYDNLLYIVAGEVIARVSGMRWEDFITERILKPLGMDHSFSDAAKLPEGANVAMPHSTDGGHARVLPLFDMNSKRFNGAAGGILSNVDDICVWMRLHLNEGRHGEGLEKRLFSRARQREMWSIHTPMPASPNPRYATHFAGYGLGWMLGDLKGNMRVSHTGGLPGMLSRIVMIPDLELGIVVLTNTSDGGGALFYAVTQTLLDSYLGLDDFGWTDKLLARSKRRDAAADAVVEKVWKTVRAAKGVRVDPGRYVGIYEDRWFGKVEVFLRGKDLWIKSHRSPKLTGSMAYYKANAFAVRWNYQDMNADAFAIFALDEEGRAERLRLKGISPRIDFSFDFQDLDLRRVRKRSR